MTEQRIRIDLILDSETTRDQIRDVVKPKLIQLKNNGKLLWVKWVYKDNVPPIFPVLHEEFI